MTENFDTGSLQLTRASSNYDHFSKPETDSYKLPELRSSASIDKTKPLPTSLQSDFLPQDVLLALTQSSPNLEKLGTVGRPKHKAVNINLVPGRAAPSNVWSHKRRERFKHLVDNTVCTCGAGKDISFLYDVPQEFSHPTKPDTVDKSALRKSEETSRQPLQLPDTLLPEEYHLVKNKGVVGIQYHDDKFSTNPEDHEKHLVVFPSMKPASRYEVVQLKNALEAMLDKAGINDLDTSVSGPTQMHKLVDLIKKEQDIYNVVFHELIRQTSIECVERGELLAELRNKYSGLLNKVPQHIMSLHEEVMAQRALDRRLTEELLRFKGTIGVLTSELSDVKDHDKKVTKEAQKAQDDLRTALAESQKNASLLSEYHDLYELQRKRLERTVFMLSDEREIWSTAAYSLALKVTEEYKLSTARRLQLSEKSWVKLANHFTVLLSDRDTDLLTKIQGCVERWRDLIEDFNIAVKERESEMRDSLKGVKTSIEGWIKTFHNKYLDPESGTVIKKPDEEFTKSLLAAVRTWDDVIIKETDVFGGDSLLNNQDELSQIRSQMDGWTDFALKVFGRHRGEESRTHPEQSNMLALNEEVDGLLQQFQYRVTGENGVASVIIQLQSSLETWETRLDSSAKGVIALQESDWDTIFQTLEDWLALFNKGIECVGSTQREEARAEVLHHISYDIHEEVRKTQKWATTASNSIDSEDAKLVEQVSSLHSEMVRWMVQVLLRLAPDKEGNSKEAAELSLLGSASLPQLTEVAKTLFDSLEKFSSYVALCCGSIVVENTQKRQDNNEENADHEMKDLNRLRTECDEWIHTAQMLMSQLTGETMESLFPTRPSTTVTKSSVTPATGRNTGRTTIVAQSEQKTVDRQETQVSDLGDRESYAQTPQQEQEVSENKADEKIEEKEVETVQSIEQTSEKQEMIDTKPEEKTQQQTTAEETNQVERANDNLEEEEEEKDEEKEDEMNDKDKEDEKKKIEILGADANTHKHSMEPPGEFASQPVSQLVEGSPDTKKAYEALTAVSQLQTQLLDAEERAQKSEERATQAATIIVTLEERIRALEKLTGTDSSLLYKEQEPTQPEPSPSPAKSTSAATPTTSQINTSPRAGSEAKEEKATKKSKSGSKTKKR